MKAYLGGNRWLWLALVGTVAFEHLVFATGGGTSPWWWAVLIIVSVTVAIALRGPHPLAAVAVIALVAGSRLLWSGPNDSPFPLSYAVAVLVLSWLAGRRADDTRRFAMVVVGVDAALLVVALVVRSDTGLPAVGLDWLVIILWSLLFVVLPWLMGRHRQQQELLATAGWERAERMEHEQQLLVEQARLRERSLIATDMHDSLGHELSLIALRAGALEVAPDLDPHHQRAAGELRLAAGTATEQLAEIIGVLREDGSRAPLAPTGEGISELVERAVASGVTVRLVRSGEAKGIPQQVRRATHRIVREGLTNATKHAPGAAVTVRIDETPAETTVSVANAASAVATERVDGPGGHGLRGLGELVDLLGGSWRSGSTEGGGFELMATLPHAAAVPADEPATTGSTSTSAQERATVRRTARRRLVVAVVAPVVMGVSVVALILGYYVGISYASILDPDDYESLRIGDSRATTEEVLPLLEMVDAPVDRGSPPPSGSTCEFYRPDGPFSISFAYRLCFDDDVLVAKDVIPTGSLPPDEENP